MSKMPKSKKSPLKYVPYVKGFRPRTAKQQLKAIGDSTYSHGLDKLFEPTAEHFLPVPRCSSVDDWLAQYNEEGQTYNEFLQQCPWMSRRKMSHVDQRFVKEGTTIQEKYPEGALYLLPLGTSSDTCPAMKTLRDFAEIFFGVPIKLLSEVQLDKNKGNIHWHKNTQMPNPKQKLKSRFNSTTGHYQLCVDPVLKGLPELMPSNALAMIALTMTDLYADKTDLFVAGMAAGRNRSAVFSFFRYHPNLSFSHEFWYRISQEGSNENDSCRQLFLLRSCRLLVHELCHLLGLDHCIFFSCLMNGSGHLQEDFRQPMFLCPVCLRKLHTLCGFDPVKRYMALKKFYENQGLSDEARWIDQRLAYIET